MSVERLSSRAWRKPALNPKGSIVRTMRIGYTTETTDGTVAVSTTAFGVVVYVKPDSRSRKKFREFCANRGLIATPAEENGNADGRYNRRTGKVEPEIDAVVTPWQVVGEGAALSELVGMDADGRRTDPKPFVSEWHFAVSIRIPVGAAGAGPVKVRPPMGTAFGRPSTIAATAAQLHADQQERYALAVKTGQM